MKAPESQPTVLLSRFSATARRSRATTIGFRVTGLSAIAQTTERIEGRVSNPSTGAYLETVRLTVEGTTLETFTDSDGNYRLTPVPAGNVKVKAFFPGSLPPTTEVLVSAGQIVRHDIQLGSFQKPPGDAGAVVLLDEFIVSTSREMSGIALAINEQRFAPHIKNVVSTDEFGNVAEGNMGEFLNSIGTIRKSRPR